MPTTQELVGKVSELQGFRQAEEWREWRLEALAALGDQSDFMREIFFLGRGYIILKTLLYLNHFLLLEPDLQEAYNMMVGWIKRKEGEQLTEKIVRAFESFCLLSFSSQICF